MQGHDIELLIKGLYGIGAGIAMAGGAIGSGIGQGQAARGAIEGMARNPEMQGTLRTNMFIAAGLIETNAIYGFVIAAILLFVK